MKTKISLIMLGVDGLNGATHFYAKGLTSPSFAIPQGVIIYACNV